MHMAAPEAVGLCHGLCPARLAAAARVFEDGVRDGDVGAASLVVLRRGQPVLARGYGSGITGSSTFMMASITKPVTAMAVLMLVEEGRLSLEDPACTAKIADRPHCSAPSHCPTSACCLSRGPF